MRRKSRDTWTSKVATESFEFWQKSSFSTRSEADGPERVATCSEIMRNDEKCERLTSG